MSSVQNAHPVETGTRVESQLKEVLLISAECGLVPYKGLVPRRLEGPLKSEGRGPKMWTLAGTLKGVNKTRITPRRVCAKSLLVLKDSSFEHQMFGCRRRRKAQPSVDIKVDVPKGPSAEEMQEAADKSLIDPHEPEGKHPIFVSDIYPHSRRPDPDAFIEYPDDFHDMTLEQRNMFYAARDARGARFKLQSVFRNQRPTYGWWKNPYNVYRDQAVFDELRGVVARDRHENRFLAQYVPPPLVKQKGAMERAYELLSNLGKLDTANLVEVVNKAVSFIKSALEKAGFVLRILLVSGVKTIAILALVYFLAIGLPSAIYKFFKHIFLAIYYFLSELCTNFVTPAQEVIESWIPAHVLALVPRIIQLEEEEGSVEEEKASFVHEGAPSVRGGIAALAMLLATAVPSLRPADHESVIDVARGLYKKIEFEGAVFAPLAEYLPSAFTDLCRRLKLFPDETVLTPDMDALLTRVKRLVSILDADPSRMLRPAIRLEYGQLFPIFETVALKWEVYSVDNLPFARLLAELRKRLKAHLERYVAADKNQKRIRPVGLYIDGKAGVGKSEIIMNLAKELCPHYAEGMAVFTKSSGDAFYSGYMGQPCVLFDDLFAGVYLEPDDKKIMYDILRMISPTPMGLNMAALEDKGMHFNSHFVGITSNRDFNDPLPLKDPQAFCRRFKGLHVELKPEFRGSDGEVDKTKVKAALTPDDKTPHLNMYTYEFTLDTEVPCQRVLTRNPITWKQLVTFIKKSRVANCKAAGFQFEMDAGEVKAEEPAPPASASSGKTPVEVPPKKPYVRVRNARGGFAGSSRRPPPEPTNTRVASKIMNPDGSDPNVSDLEGQVPISEEEMARVAQWIDEHPEVTQCAALSVAEMNAAVPDGKEDADDELGEKPSLWHLLLSKLTNMDWPKVIGSIICLGAVLSSAAMLLAKVIPGLSFESSSSSSKFAKRQVIAPNAHRISLGQPLVHEMLAVSAEDSRIAKHWETMRVASQKILQNTVRISRPGGKMNAFIPQGRELWVSAHFFLIGRPAREGDLVTISYSDGVERSFTLSLKSIRYVELGQHKYDVASLRLPEEFPEMPSLSCVQNRATVPRVHDLTAVYLLRPQIGVDAVEVEAAQYITYSAGQPFTSGSRENPELFLTPSHYDYGAVTREGDCGTPLVGLTQEGTVRLIGIHMGSQWKGIQKFSKAIPVYKELFDGAFHLEMDQKDFLPCDPMSGLPDCIQTLGRTAVPRSIHAGSSLVKSPLAYHPLLEEVTHQPARLSGQGEDSTIEKLKRAVSAICPNGQKLKPIPQDIIGPVVDQMVEEARERRKDVEPYILTEEEQCNGWKSIKPLSMKKTPGPPLDALRAPGEAGRSRYFNVDLKTGVISVNHEALRAELNKLETKEAFLVFGLGLKDELRRLEKIHSPRLIMFAPVAMTMKVREQFGAWCETDRFQHSRPSCVGMNVDSADWNELIERLTARGRILGFDADYSFFDSLISGQIIDAFKRVTDAYYEDCPGADKELRHLLIDNCMVAKMLLGDVLLAKDVGGTTGNPLTVHLNNFMNELLLRCAFRSIMIEAGEPLLQQPEAFHHNVGLAVYGDDNVNTVTPEVGKLYNFDSVSRTLGAWGVVYTPASKSKGPVAPLVHFDKLSFLSRTTRIDHTHELGVPCLAVPVKEDYRSLKYISKKLDPTFALTMNVTGILYRSVGLGSKGYMKEKAKLVKFLADGNIEAHLPLWTDVSRNFHERLYDFTNSDAVETPFHRWNADQKIALTPFLAAFQSKKGIPVSPSWPNATWFEHEMADTLRNDTIVAPEEKGEPLAPASKLPQSSAMEALYVEDLMKRYVRVIDIPASTSPTSYQGVDVVSLFCPNPASPDQQLSTTLRYFSSTYRFRSGPTGVVVYGGQSGREQHISATSNLFSPTLGAQFVSQFNNSTRIAGGMPIVIGQPADMPNVAMLPYTGETSENLLTLPINYPEVAANRDPNLWGGCYFWNNMGPEDGAPNMQVWGTVHDGFRMAMAWRILPRVYLPPPEGFVHEMGNAVGAAIKKPLTAVKGVYSNVKKVVDQGIDVAEKTADAFSNFDTPNIGGNGAEPGCLRKGVDMATMNNVRYAMVLGPLTGEPPPALVPTGTGKSETLISTFVQIPWRFQNRKISITDVPFTILTRVPLTVAPNRFTTLPTTSAQIVGPMEHIAQAFNFWSADIEVIIQIIAPMLANMRLGVLVRIGEFGALDPGPIPMSEFSKEYAKVWEFGQEDTLKITVPYLATSNWLRVPPPFLEQSNRPEDYAFGELLIVLLTEYQVNETMHTSADMNVFMACSNAKFQTPAEGLGYMTIDPNALPQDEKFEHEMEHTGAVGGNQDSDEVKEVAARPLGGPEYPSVNADGPANLWERQFVIANVPWPTAAPAKTLLWSRRLPAEIIPDGPTAAVIHSFKFLRCELEFSFSLSTSVSSQGQLVAFYLPMSVPYATADEQKNNIQIDNILMLPHVLIKAARTTQAVLKVPFVHPRNAIDLSKNDWRETFGSVHLMVYNEFFAGADAPTQHPRVNISVKFLNMELSVPNPNAPMPGLGFQMEMAPTVGFEEEELLNPDDEVLEICGRIFEPNSLVTRWEGRDAMEELDSVYGDRPGTTATLLMFKREREDEVYELCRQSNHSQALKSLFPLYQFELVRKNISSKEREGEWQHQPWFQAFYEDWMALAWSEITYDIDELTAMSEDEMLLLVDRALATWHKPMVPARVYINVEWSMYGAAAAWRRKMADVAEGHILEPNFQGLAGMAFRVYQGLQFDGTKGYPGEGPPLEEIKAPPQPQEEKKLQHPLCAVCDVRKPSVRFRPDFVKKATNNRLNLEQVNQFQAANPEMVARRWQVCASCYKDLVVHNRGMVLTMCVHCGEDYMIFVEQASIYASLHSGCHAPFQAARANIPFEEHLVFKCMCRIHNPDHGLPHKCLEPGCENTQRHEPLLSMEEIHRLSGCCDAHRRVVPCEYMGVKPE